MTRGKKVIQETLSGKAQRHFRSPGFPALSPGAVRAGCYTEEPLKHRHSKHGNHHLSVGPFATVELLPTLHGGLHAPFVPISSARNMSLPQGEDRG